VTLAWAEFAAVWTLLAANILSPGPNVLNTVATAMGSGRGAGLGAATGVGIGISFWCLGMSLGMAALFAAVPAARTLLTLAAVTLLGWFALRYLRSGIGGLHRHGLTGDPRSLPAGRAGMTAGRAFWRSVSVSLANPKALTTWLAIHGIFPLARAGAGDIALLWAGAAAIAVAIHGGYALVFSTQAAARLYLRAAPLVNAGVGLFFLWFAVRIAAPLWP
jgi:threonine/homoserine/homoserine lactone efflux protein